LFDVLNVVFPVAVVSTGGTSWSPDITAVKGAASTTINKLEAIASRNSNDNNAVNEIILQVDFKDSSCCISAILVIVNYINYE
jgi:hypothetical protein